MSATTPEPSGPRTATGRALLDYMRASFVYEADDTEPVDITDRILAIEAESSSGTRGVTTRPTADMPWNMPWPASCRHCSGRPADKEHAAILLASAMQEAGYPYDTDTAATILDYLATDVGGWDRIATVESDR